MLSDEFLDALDACTDPSDNLTGIILCPGPSQDGASSAIKDRLVKHLQGAGFGVNPLPGFTEFIARGSVLAWRRLVSEAHDLTTDPDVVVKLNGLAASAPPPDNTDIA